MRYLKSISAAFDRWDGGVPDHDLYFELVRGLYSTTSTPRALLGATLAALVVIAAAGIESRDPAFVALFLAFLAIGCLRSAGAWAYHRRQHDPADLADIRHWELRALSGAWVFSALVGISGAYTLLMHPDTRVEILTDGCVIGYIAGISSRNASRPLITLGQISFTCVPFLAALIWRFDMAHAVLATFIGLLYLGTVLVCHSVFENIVSRHLAYRRIETMAQRDALTGLLNRSAFLDLLEKQFKTVEHGRANLALISIDLDQFKDINDTLGHPAGDAVLCEIAHRIQSILLPGDKVARVGGDEFLVMLLGQRVLHVDSVAQQLLARLCDPLRMDGLPSVCGGSIGWAMAPHDGADVDALLRNADLALYEAKRSGRSRVVAYSPSMTQHYEHRLALELDLKFALPNGELYLEYQPIVDPRSGRAIGCEALLRWQHPVYGTIPPDEFIPIAESTGLIVPIGEWVLANACAEAMHWSADVKVAVNLSPVQFRHGHDIVDVVMKVLAKTGLPADRLDLEITESVLMDDSATTVEILDELRGHGVGISLDDFGTGFASLAYLNDFPFTKIKIDRKFTQNLGKSPRTSAIIKGIAQITRDLSIERVAEGIETEDQLETMKRFGINAVQGYLYSRPVSRRASPRDDQTADRPARKRDGKNGTADDPAAA